MAVEQIGCDDSVQHSCLVFHAQKDKTFGRAGALAYNHASGYAHYAAITHAPQLARGDYATRVHFIAPVTHGMPADGESSAPEIGVHALFDVHLCEWRSSLWLRQSFEQGAGRLCGMSGLPQRIPAMRGFERIQRTGFSQFRDLVLPQLGHAPDEIVNIAVGRASPLTHNGLSGFGAEAFYVHQAE